MTFDPASVSLVLAAISLLVAVLSLADQRFIVQVKNERREAEIQSGNAQRFIALETKMDIFWKCIERNAPNLLHSPHTPELDRLLERMAAGKLDYQDKCSLKLMIEHRLQSGTFEEPKRITATIVLGALEQQLLDKDKKED